MVLRGTVVTSVSSANFFSTVVCFSFLNDLLSGFPQPIHLLTFHQCLIIFNSPESQNAQNKARKKNCKGVINENTFSLCFHDKENRKALLIRLMLRQVMHY